MNKYQIDENILKNLKNSQFYNMSNKQTVIYQK